MKNRFRLSAALLLPIFLAGCEVFSNGEVNGQLKPFTTEQATVLTDYTGMALPNTALSVTGAVDLQVSSDCMGDDRAVTLAINGSAWLKPGTGSLTLGEQTYTITHVSCTHASQSLNEAGIDSIGLFIAQAVDTTLSAEVAIVLARIGQDAPDTPSAQFAPLTGQTVLLVFPHIYDTISPDILAPIAIAAGIVELDPVLEDPAVQGRQVIEQATRDLNELITDDFSFVNWILSGAVNALQRASNDRFWASENELDNQRGRRAFSKVSIAINEIERIADNTSDTALMNSLDAITTSVLDEMRDLAIAQINVATDNSGDDYRLARASYFIESGDIARGQDYLRRATRLYGKAWTVANRSLR